jgi:hypothetical protein
MRFESEHRFHGSPRAVAALLADPSFYTSLVLPDVRQPVVLDHQDEGRLTTLRFRYEFAGRLDPLAARVLGSDRPAWIQEVEVDSTANSGQLSFRAEAKPKLLHGSANFVLIADGGSTIRRMSGDLVVGLPVIGSRAEKRILPGLVRRLDIEAQALDEHLQTAQSGQ